MSQHFSYSAWLSNLAPNRKNVFTAVPCLCTKCCYLATAAGGLSIRWSDILVTERYILLTLIPQKRRQNISKTKSRKRGWGRGGWGSEGEEKKKKVRPSRHKQRGDRSKALISVFSFFFSFSFFLSFFPFLFVCLLVFVFSLSLFLSVVAGKAGLCRVRSMSFAMFSKPLNDVS